MNCSMIIFVLRNSLLIVLVQEEDVFVLIDKIPKPPVYKDEMTWKRFLSPLPRHKG